MPITISNLTVAQGAPTGTIVGLLTARDVGSIIPCNFILSKKSSGYFAISSNNLITAWSGSIAPGYYPVRVRAVGINTRFSSSATFVINVIDPPSPPTPIGITFVTTTASLADNSLAGTTVATFSVSMSDGSSFAGTLGGSPAGTVAISGSTRLVLARALTPADDGSWQWGVVATQNGVTVSSSIAVQVIRVSPPPPPPAPPPPPPFTQGINFRETSGYITDPAGYTYDVTHGSADYPFTTPQGNVVGWEIGPVDANDRDNSLDPRLAGIAYGQGGSLTFRFDLPAPGTYNIQVAMGDTYPATRTGATMEVFDNVTSLGKIINGATTGPGQWADATGTVRTSAANWVAANPQGGGGAGQLTLTFSSKICRFTISSSTNDYYTLASLFVASVGAPPPPQVISAVTLSNSTFVGGSGSANRVIGTAMVALSPASPAFNGTRSLSGPDTSKFVINSSTGVLSVGSSDLAVGTYSVNLVATGAYPNSPFSQPESLNGISGSGGVLAISPSTVRPATGDYPLAYTQVTITGSPGNPGDWVNFAPAGSPSSYFTGIKYYINGVGGSGPGLTNAVINLPTPNSGTWAAAGNTPNWEVRFYPNDSLSPSHTVPATVDVLKRSEGFFPSFGAPLGNNGTTVILPRVSATNTPPPTAASVQIISGTVAFDIVLQFNLGGTIANRGLTYQFTVDDVPIGGYLTGPPFLPSINTLTALGGNPIPDGTHAIGVRVVDVVGATYAGGTLPYQCRCVQLIVIVANNGMVNGSQVVPVIDSSGGPSYRQNSNALDFVIYPGTPSSLQNAVVPLPTPASGFIPPVTNPASPFYGNAIALRNRNNFYLDGIDGAVVDEYKYAPQFYTTKSGGVFAAGYSVEESLDIETSYHNAIRHQNFDGGRNNNQTDPYSNFVDAPDGSAFVGVDLMGRVYKLDFTGAVSTLVGWTLNRAVLPYEKSDGTITETDLQTRLTTIGTRDFGDFFGCNDLCFDPRNPKILYVAKTLDHFIYRADLSQNPPVCTRFAGYEGGINGDGVGGFADGPALSSGSNGAQFHEPYSICMQARTDVPGHPQGTMYVADNGNSRIRVISADGSTVTTLFGNQTNIPSISNTPAIGALIGTFAVTSATWASGTATVVTSVNTPITGVDWTIELFGATQTGPGGNGYVNGGFTVNGFTDARHFTLSMPDFDYFSFPGGGAIATGPLGGSMTVNVYSLDIYSPGGAAIPWSTAYAACPQTVRMSSAGHLVLGEAWSMNIRDIDLINSTIRYAGTFGRQSKWGVGRLRTGSTTRSALLHGNGNNWLWFDIDSAGTCGLVDDCVICEGDSGDAGTAGLISRISLDASYGDDFGGEDVNGASPMPEGGVGGGHYPWSIAISKHQGRMISSGIADQGLFGWRILAATDHKPDIINNINVDAAALNRGYYDYTRGTIQGVFPFGCRPSGWQLRGIHGLAHLGIPLGSPSATSFDEIMINYPDDASLAAFIQSGMGGAIPRPEFTGDDLADLIYFIRRASLPGSYPIPLAMRAQFATDVTAPVISGITTSRVSTTSIRVQWTTDKPTYGFVAAGSPNAAGTQLPYHIVQMEAYGGPDINSSYRTSHDVTITGLPGVTVISPTHFVVSSKDMAGNNSVSSDLALS